MIFLIYTLKIHNMPSSSFYKHTKKDCITFGTQSQWTDFDLVSVLSGKLSALIINYIMDYVQKTQYTIILNSRNRKQISFNPPFCVIHNNKVVLL